MGGQVQHGWASVSVSVFLCVAMVSKYESKGPLQVLLYWYELQLTSVFFSGGVQMYPQERKNKMSGHELLKRLFLTQRLQVFSRLLLQLLKRAEQGWERCQCIFFSYKAEH